MFIIEKRYTTYRVTESHKCTKCGGKILRGDYADRVTYEHSGVMGDCWRCLECRGTIA